MKTILLTIAVSFLVHYSNASELFIRVLKQGNYYARIGQQTQYNNTNIFRFFELPEGNLDVQITDQNSGYTLTNTKINAMYNERIVAEVDSYGQFVILQRTPIEIVNWFTTVTPYTQPYFNFTNNQNNTQAQAQLQAQQQTFNQFLTYLGKENFDQNKYESAKLFIDKGNLTSDQIAQIARKFTFDSNRLNWCKYAYTKCTDKINYFMLKNEFTFNSSYSELQDYMASH